MQNALRKVAVAVGAVFFASSLSLAAQAPTPSDAGTPTTQQHAKKNSSKKKKRSGRKGGKKTARKTPPR
jgi:hypothetical protein